MVVPNFTYRNSVNSLANFTSPALVIPNLRGRDIAAIVQELSVLLQREARIPDLLPFYHAALNREFLCSTATSPGFAFPHARLKAISGLSFALGRTQEPISWGPKSGLLVNLIFLSAVPATDSTDYFALISGFAQLSRDSKLLLKLNSARDAFEMMSVLQQVKLRITPKALLL
jgi:mannitol/fructose-specific phosphotransferase system IIA component (Ntr-type)